MSAYLKLPFYAKASLILIGLYVLTNVLIIAQDILVPIIFGVLIAIIISPVVNYLIKKKIPKTVSIFIVLTISFLSFILFFILLLSQLSLLGEALPELTKKVVELTNDTIKWISSTFNVSVSQITDWIASSKSELLENSNLAIGKTLATVGGILTPLMLTPVYAFMVLYYRKLLVTFIKSVFSNDSRISEILTETKSIIQNYLIGLVIEFVIIAVLNSVGLLVLGFEYAILLGIIGALLNIIPYIGGLIAVIIYIIIAIITLSPVYVLYVVILYSVIQVIDNNYIVPKIVGSKVKLNALVSIVVIIIGGALWGISGMFLSIPITAVMKLIFSRIDSLKPWGILLGEEDSAKV